MNLFVGIPYHFQKGISIVLLQSKHADILLKFGLFGQSHFKTEHIHTQVKNVEENSWPSAKNVMYGDN